MLNERFKELAEQCGLGVKHDGIILTKNVNAAEAFEKFTRAIVLECARISNEEDYTMTNQGAASAQAFMEYFGVEE